LKEYLLMKLFAILNDELIKHNEAKISINDRGFRYGDGIFTTIALINKVPLFWDLHLMRLQNGLSALKIDAKITNLLDNIKILIEKNAINIGILRIIITRGEGSKGYTPTNQSSANILLELENTKPLINNLINHTNFNNQSINLSVSKWCKPPPQCLPTEFKLMQGLNPTLARIEALQNGYDEALMLSHDRVSVSEAAASNIFWFEGEELCTPPLETGCLNGVMRQKIMQIVNVEKRLISHIELSKKSSFTTNCLNGLTEIKTINNIILPSCKMQMQMLQDKLKKAIHAEMKEYI
jgi:branched-subunit amino acid aminotransferase/4-amino-4-deoxychorismate lyase